jgi:SnoaL-like domain
MTTPSMVRVSCSDGWAGVCIIAAQRREGRPTGRSFLVVRCCTTAPHLTILPAMDDLEQIKQLKARYCRTMDTKDWTSMRRLFADDVTVDTTDSGGGLVTGADEFMTFLEATIGDVVTVRQCHTPEIDLESPTRASGVWAMEEMLRWPDGTELHGYGHYHETYEKRSGRWCIASCTLTRLRMDFTPPAP